MLSNIIRNSLNKIENHMLFSVNAMSVDFIQKDEEEEKREQERTWLFTEIRAKNF